jgi:hypothetical protein
MVANLAPFIVTPYVVAAKVTSVAFATFLTTRNFANGVRYGSKPNERSEADLGKTSRKRS